MTWDYGWPDNKEPAEPTLCDSEKTWGKLLKYCHFLEVNHSISFADSADWFQFAF